jgi:hypothetical protein
MREDGYRSVQIRKSALAALESTAVRLSVVRVVTYQLSCTWSSGLHPLWL